VLGGRGGSASDTAALLQAGTHGADWVIPGTTYGGNRLMTLTQIDPSNVATLRKAWVTAVRDNGKDDVSECFTSRI
jgi:glucose dehydrogenase